jgi:hypothetical protein
MEEEMKYNRLNKIERLKDELHDTDFIVLKAMEGHDVRQYGDYKTMRQHLRDEINLIESLTDEQYFELYPIEDELGDAKRKKLMDINVYDQSDKVNVFYLGEKAMWLDAQTRQTLRISVESYKAMGVDNVTKWFGGQEFTFPVNTWLQMLNVLEAYAGEALNVTEAHKAEVMAMDSVEAVEQYDITQGYPATVEFTPQRLAQMSKEYQGL